MSGFVVKFTVTLALLCVIDPGKAEWCDLKCGHDENTMCVYEEKNSTEECTSIKKVMTLDMGYDLLDMHNKLRNDIASGTVKCWPPAADMMKLTWDDDLEKSAERWATQCEMKHDVCRRTPKFERAGQNLAWSVTNGTEQQDVTIVGWTDEIDKVANPPHLVNIYQFDEEYGHFTQVVWATTRKMGCGIITYQKKNRNWQVIACNYGPGGNVEGSKMYTKGEPCTACPEGTKCDPDSNYPNLCA